MKIDVNDHGETLLTHKGRREPLNIPITEVTDAAELVLVVDEYFEKIPAVFHTTLLMPGILQSENPCATLEGTCRVIVELIDLMKTEPVAADSAVLVVLYDRYKRSLTMVIGKLRYQLGPDTLISQQVGNA